MDAEVKEEKKEVKRVTFDLPTSKTKGGSGGKREQEVPAATLAPKRKGFRHNGKYYPDWEESYPPPEDYSGRVFKDKFAAPERETKGGDKKNDKEPKKKGMARDGWWYPDWIGPKTVPDWFIKKEDTRRFPDKNAKKGGEKKRR